MPAPQQVLFRILREWPILLKNSWFTLFSVLTGFAASVVVGLPIAFAIVLSRTIERLSMPILVMSQTIPKVAIAPILVVWLGFGILPKIAIVFSDEEQVDRLLAAGSADELVAVLAEVNES